MKGLFGARGADCRKKFMENAITIEDMEIRSTEALELEVIFS